jgi:hypothetical protein
MCDEKRWRLLSRSKAKLAMMINKTKNIGFKPSLIGEMRQMVTTIFVAANTIQRKYESHSHSTENIMCNNKPTRP